jgi:hypothetical protein
MGQLLRIQNITSTHLACHSEPSCGIRRIARDTVEEPAVHTRAVKAGFPTLQDRPRADNPDALEMTELGICAIFRNFQ